MRHPTYLLDYGIFTHIHIRNDLELTGTMRPCVYFFFFVPFVCFLQRFFFFCFPPLSPATIVQTPRRGGYGRSIKRRLNITRLRMNPSTTCVEKKFSRKRPFFFCQTFSTTCRSPRDHHPALQTRQLHGKYATS